VPKRQYPVYKAQVSGRAYRHAAAQRVESGLHASGGQRFGCRLCDRIYAPGVPLHK